MRQEETEVARPQLALDGLLLILLLAMVSMWASCEASVTRLPALVVWPKPTPIDAILWRWVPTAPTATPTPERPQPSSRSPAREGYLTTATYYHPSLAGEPMRSGEKYDPKDPSVVATNWYAMGTVLRLTRIDTGWTITVTVQDTGSERLTIDLSQAGFLDLGVLAEGRIPVFLEEVKP